MYENTTTAADQNRIRETMVRNDDELTATQYYNLGYNATTPQALKLAPDFASAYFNRGQFISIKGNMIWLLLYSKSIKFF